MKYYLFAMLPNIKTLLGVIIAVLFALAILGIVATAQNENTLIKENNEESDFRSIKLLFGLGCIFSLIMTFIPNQKQLAFIIAAPYIVENQQLQEAGKNSAEIIKLGTEYLKQSLSNEIKGEWAMKQKIIEKFVEGVAEASGIVFTILIVAAVVRLFQWGK